MRLKKLTRRSSRPTRSRGLKLESLEHRRVLATFNPLPSTPDAVAPDVNDNYSLRAAIIEANQNGEDDVITLAAGTYSLTLAGGSEGFSNAVWFRGEGVDPNESNQEAVFDLDILDDGHTLTIRGAGIGSTVLTNSADRVFHVNHGASFVLEDVTIANSTNRYDGGGLLNDGGDATLRRVEIKNNTALGDKISNDELIDGGGGGIANWFAQYPGISRAGNLIIEDSFIRDNTASDRNGRGGGIYVRGGTVTLRNTVVEGNDSQGSADTFSPSGGGGIMVDGNLFVEDSIIRDNLSDAGAGIAVAGGNATITGSEIGFNEVDDSEGRGGGIFNAGGGVIVTDTYIHDNQGDVSGGGVHVAGGTLEVYNSTIANNTADRNGQEGGGGGIHNDGGNITIVNTTISGNSSYNTGGILMNGGFLNMTFSTVVGNNSTLSSFSSRGAFQNIGATQFIVDHSIIVDNRGGSNPSGWEGEIQGGGWVIYNGPNTPFFTNKGTQTQNNDLDATGDSLNLGPLADNGGPVPTHALLEGSVAIDAGRNTGGHGTNFGLPPETDARGVSRPQGNVVDIGAFEFEVPNSPPTADAGGPYTAPLDSNSVLIDGSNSSDPDAGDTLSYAWDLDNDGEFDDSFSASPTFSLAGYGINTVGNHVLRLQVTDLSLEQDIDTTILTVTAGQVVNRQIFYNNSFFDNNNPAANANDDGAIVHAKSALLPGQSGTQSNIINYSKGINGIVVDIDGSAQSGSITAADFSFRMGRTNDFSSWVQAPAPSSVVVRPGAGMNGSDRVMLTWPDHSITNNWLEVEVLATDNTGLGASDKFYFGNAVGDAGLDPTRAEVNGTDFNETRANTHNFLNRALITDDYDFNRDSLVNSTDLAIVRDNTTTIINELRMITPASSFGKSEGEGEGSKQGIVLEESKSSANEKTTDQAVSGADIDLDVDGDLPVNQELLVVSGGENESSPLCSVNQHELDSAIDLIADDLAG